MDNVLTNLFEKAKEATTLDERLSDWTDEGDQIPMALNGRGDVVVLNEVIAAVEKRRPAPRRRAMSAVLDEVDSFVELINRHKRPQSVAFADVGAGTVSAVFDFHEQNRETPAESPLPGWCEDHATLRLKKDPTWVAWRQKCSGGDREADDLTQDELASWLEDRREDVCAGPEGDPGPSLLDLMKLARDLEVHASGTIIRRVNPTAGNYEMVARNETNEATSTKIPRAFFVALRPFEGCDLYRVEIRISFSAEGGSASFGLRMHNPDDVERDAVKDVVKKVREKTGLPVFMGRR